MHAPLPRYIALAVSAGVLSLSLTACGSSSSDSSEGKAPGSGGDAGTSTAKESVAKYGGDTAFTVAALPSKPPAGKKVAQVNCSSPTCSPGGLAAPVKALGWTLDVFEYDLAKGPQDLARAFDQALNTKPDYLSVTMAFPEKIVAKQLARAKSEGIPVINVGGSDDTSSEVIIQNPSGFRTAGQISADVALADAEGPVHVVLPLDPGIPLSKLIAAGAEDEVKKLRADSSAEEVDLSLGQPAATNVASLVNYLKRKPDTNYVILGGSTFYPGVKQGLEAAGLAKKVKIVLAYPFVNDIQSIKDGDFLAGVAGEATHQWRQADAMARLSVGEKLATKTPLSSFRILTPKNASVERIDPPDFVKAYTSAWGV